MADLFDGYPPGAAWDAMFDRAGQVRSPYREVHEALAEMSAGELGARAERLTRTYINRGVTFDFAEEERPFPIDVVPRVLDGAEWDLVFPGVAQRIRAPERGPGARLGDRPGARRAGQVPGARRQRRGAEWRQLRPVEPSDHGADFCRPLCGGSGCEPSRTTRGACWPPSPPRRPTGSTSRPSSSALPGCSTARTSSTRCSPGPWGRARRGSGPLLLGRTRVDARDERPTPGGSRTPARSRRCSTASASSSSTARRAAARRTPG